MKAANDAGGKDNVTVVYLEGDRFRATVAPAASPASSRALAYALMWLLLMGAGFFAWRAAGYPLPAAVTSAFGVSPDTTIIVQHGGSIAAAIARAAPGASVLVEPGEYRERLTQHADGTRTFQSEGQQDDGSWAEIMTARYRRRG